MQHATNDRYTRIFTNTNKYNNHDLNINMTIKRKKKDEKHINPCDVMVLW